MSTMLQNAVVNVYIVNFYGMIGISLAVRNTSSIQSQNFVQSG